MGKGRGVRSGDRAGYQYCWQRSNRIRLEKVNKEMAGYQFQGNHAGTLHSELNERFVETYFLTRNILFMKRNNFVERLLAEMKLQTTERKHFTDGSLASELRYFY